MCLARIPAAEEGVRHDAARRRGFEGLVQVTDISAITTGPQAGAFAIIDSENSELVVFTLP